MKRIAITAGALAALGMIPVSAVACEEYNETMANATPPAKLASTEAQPAASRAPQATTAKTVLSKATRAAPAKTDAAAAKTDGGTDSKVATTRN